MDRVSGASMVVRSLFWLESLLLIASMPAAATVVNFDPGNPGAGPFPTDYLTTPDAAQKTGARINLPMPDCDSAPSDCLEVAALNELDGFHLLPTVNVSFSGPVNPTTLKSGID